MKLKTLCPNIIGLCADRMGSGKTTAALMLVEEFGFVRLSFALPIKKMVQTFLGDCGLHPKRAASYVHDAYFKETVLDFGPLKGLGVTPRSLMQTLGTEWGRQLVGNHIWIDMLKAKAQDHLAEGRSVVIDDMRFINEAETIRDMGGAIVRITRFDGLPESTHASESHMPDRLVDYELDNRPGTSMNALHDRIEAILTDMDA